MSEQSVMWAPQEDRDTLPGGGHGAAVLDSFDFGDRDPDWAYVLDQQRADTIQLLDANSRLKDIVESLVGIVEDEQEHARRTQGGLESLIERLSSEIDRLGQRLSATERNLDHLIAALVAYLAAQKKTR